MSLDFGVDIPFVHHLGFTLEQVRALQAKPLPPPVPSR